MKHFLQNNKVRSQRPVNAHCLRVIRVNNAGVSLSHAGPCILNAKTQYVTNLNQENTVTRQLNRSFINELHSEKGLIVNCRLPYRHCKTLCFPGSSAVISWSKKIGCIAGQQ